MKRTSFKTATQNLIKNFFLLLSTGAALCHYFAPSLMSVGLMLCLFSAVVVLSIFNLTKPKKIENRALKTVSIVLTFFISAIGCEIFVTTWHLSNKVAALAENFGLTRMQLLLIVGLIGCVAGLYAVYTLSCHIVNIVFEILKKKLKIQEKHLVIANLKKNYYLPLSAFLFFMLGANFKIAHFAGALIAVSVFAIIASQKESVFEIIGDSSIGMKVYSILSAVGICFGMMFSFYVNLLLNYIYLGSTVFNILCYFSILLAIGGLFFAYFCVSYFYLRIKRIFKETGLLKGIKSFEYIFYALLVIASLVLVVFAFSQTDAFYGTNYEFDIIYTSDSPTLVNQNVYLSLMHRENDLRQPLFAVFASPFVSVPYLVCVFIGANVSLRAILLNSVQVLMLVFANFMLARAMKLNTVKRICFVLLASCTYTSLLFSLMMEQYIVAYFWLAFCVYMICEVKKVDRLVLFGAGGTLITSMVMMLSLSDKSPIKRFKEWFFDMLQYGIEFLVLMLAFCRFDVIMNLTTKASSLSGFAEVKLTVFDKIYQYTEFVKNLFLPPNASESFVIEEHISWQLNEITSISLIGVALIVLAILGAVVNRDKTSSIIALCWVGFSFVMLVGLGWGTAENGLILYALYFGWAFLMLIYQLFEWIFEKVRLRFVFPIVCVAASGFLIYKNIPAIMEMIDFAINCFPISK
ncbi:MAG: hypothetical protein J6Q89_04770 [Clostridia bacterium]|nr:hypothetical protein [Clostridia bacterium]